MKSNSDCYAGQRAENHLTKIWKLPSAVTISLCATPMLWQKCIFAPNASLSNWTLFSRMLGATTLSYLVGDEGWPGASLKALRGQVPVSAGTLAGQLHASRLPILHNLAQPKILEAHGHRWIGCSLRMFLYAHRPPCQSMHDVETRKAQLGRLLDEELLVCL